LKFLLMTFQKKKIFEKKKLAFSSSSPWAARFSLEELLERQFILRKSEKKDPEERFCSSNQKGNFFPIAYTLRVLVVSLDFIFH